jgi:hemoglobin/transferrin/lactoferrin receptor protein
MNIGKKGYVLNPFEYLGNYLVDVPQEAIDGIRRWPDAQIVSFYRDTIGLPNYQGTAFAPKMHQLQQRSYQVGANLKFRGLTVGLTEIYRQDHSSIGRAPLLFSYANPYNLYGEKIQRASLTYEKQGNKFRFLANASYLRYRSDLGTSFGVNYENGHGNTSYTFEASDDLFGEALITYSPNANWDLLGGVSYQASSAMPQTNDLASPFVRGGYAPFTSRTPEAHPIYGLFGYNPTRIFNGSAFAQAFYHKNRWVLLAGVRFIRASNYQVKADENDVSQLPNLPAEFSPRLGALYKVSEKASFRFSAASGFRAPSPSTAFASLALPNTENGNLLNDSINYQRIPNPDLAPEISRSEELGFRYSFTNKFFIDVALFTNTVYNRINSQFRPIDRAQYPSALVNTRLPDGTVTALAREWTNDNGSYSQLVGLQIYAKWQHLVPRYKLSADLAIMLSKGSEILPGGGGELEDYREVPRSLLQWNISFVPTKKTYIRIENVLSSSWLRRNIAHVDQVSERYARTAGYYVVDLHLRYELSKNLTAFLKVMNALNTQYAGIGATGLDVDLFYNPQLLRNIQIGLNFSK